MRRQRTAVRNKTRFNPPAVLRSRKDRRKGGRKEGRKDGKKEGRKERRTGGREERKE